MRHHTDRIAFGSSEIVYRIDRTSRRRTIAITVNPDASVNVVAPSGTRSSRIATTVGKKAEWILKQKDWFSRNARVYRRRLVSGESLLHLGRQYQLKVVLLAGQKAIPHVTLTHGTLMVTLPRRWAASRRRSDIRSALIEWYSKRAESYLAPLIQRYADHLAVKYTSIQIRNMRTRWGSGGVSGRLRFNWRILMAPRRLIEYIVAHELCHIRYSDHSQAFWRLLSQVMPDHERRRNELEINGLKYDF
ncbi:MAG: M48 family metallopeptidase [Planctomycetaceae bacterium]|nr:M48 family metallopeptidase [Planctomycetaceae bacterium]